MNDQELLELAAKAVGYEKDWHWNHHFIMSAGGSVKEGNSWVTWNPLLNDGDALRLAVKLRLRFKFSDEWAVCEEGTYKKYGSIRAEDLNIQDPYAATRRAIVMAAAELGKGM